MNEHSVFNRVELSHTESNRRSCVNEVLLEKKNIMM